MIIAIYMEQIFEERIIELTYKCKGINCWNWNSVRCNFIDGHPKDELIQSILNKYKKIYVITIYKYGNSKNEYFDRNPQNEYLEILVDDDIVN